MWNSKHEVRQKTNETRRQKAAKLRQLKALTPKQPSKKATKKATILGSPIQTLGAPPAPIRPTTKAISQHLNVPKIRLPTPPLRSTL
jgi:hypothetical protein